MSQQSTQQKVLLHQQLVKHQLQQCRQGILQAAVTQLLGV
jgi:hypothetical protein